MPAEKNSKEYQLGYVLGHLIGSIDRILNGDLKDPEKISALKGLIEEQKKIMGIKK